MKGEEIDFQFDMVYDALCKLAKGAKTVETIDEYTYSDNGEKKLKSKKTVTKVSPPDLCSIKILLSLSGEKDFSTLTDEELKEEKEKLLKLINQIDND